MTTDTSKTIINPALATFRQFAGTYLMVECIEIVRLKGAISRNLEKPWTATFRAELHAIMHEDAMTQQEFESITHDDFDTPEEFKSWLNQVWAFLYEDGPDPS